MLGTGATPTTPLMRIIPDGKDGGTSQSMMMLLKDYPYKKVKPSSAYASPGANLEQQMEPGNRCLTHSRTRSRNFSPRSNGTYFRRKISKLSKKQSSLGGSRLLVGNIPEVGSRL
jgi:hypothetical protein